MSKMEGCVVSTQVTSKAEKKVSIPKDKQGSAIISMILGIVTALFIFLAIVIEVITYGYTDVGQTFFIIACVFSLVGFPLGLSARKSSRGRGMAIAGIALTVLPFLIMILAIILSILTFILMAI